MVFITSDSRLTALHIYMLRIHVVYTKAKAVLYSKCVMASDSPMQGSPSLETKEAPGEKKSNRYVPGRFSGLAGCTGLKAMRLCYQISGP